MKYKITNISDITLSFIADDGEYSTTQKVAVGLTEIGVTHKRYHILEPGESVESSAFPADPRFKVEIPCDKCNGLHELRLGVFGTRFIVDGAETTELPCQIKKEETEKKKTRRVI